MLHCLSFYFLVLSFVGRGLRGPCTLHILILNLLSTFGLDIPPARDPYLDYSY
jgi:hypothetical protein